MQVHGVRTSSTTLYMYLLCCVAVHMLGSLDIDVMWIYMHTVQENAHGTEDFVVWWRKLNCVHVVERRICIILKLKFSCHDGGRNFLFQYSSLSYKLRSLKYFELFFPPCVQFQRPVFGWQERWNRIYWLVAVLLCRRVLVTARFQSWMVVSLSGSCTIPYSAPMAMTSGWVLTLICWIWRNQEW